MKTEWTNVQRQGGWSASRSTKPNDAGPGMYYFTAHLAPVAGGGSIRHFRPAMVPIHPDALHGHPHGISGTS
ncbi:hypothetical protein PGT21_020437 [Puccinia graminis f. sp. tritici]|uniref:Uncharacterized protein n=1 Tax=Puccinia graminis f. sp. tritici TaxID=56615 RepID=A0A5B0NE62_PUCGR|nr:hypothetical protein PGT21_020437 [Puccinia graminis f. sp. tritici]